MESPPSTAPTPDPLGDARRRCIHALPRRRWPPSTTEVEVVSLRQPQIPPGIPPPFGMLRQGAGPSAGAARRVDLSRTRPEFEDGEEG